MNPKPFEIIRWESAEPPTLDFLTRMMQREALEASQNELAGKSRSPEMQFEQTRVLVMVQGQLQLAFPGYGSIDVDPGDIVEISPGILHDMTVNGAQPAIVLQALRD